MEVAWLTCKICDEKCRDVPENNPEFQNSEIRKSQIVRFRNLDYDYHRLICTPGGHPIAFATFVNCKQKVDRLCVLILARDEISAVLVDYEDIALALEDGSKRKSKRFFDATTIT